VPRHAPNSAARPADAKRHGLRAVNSPAMQQMIETVRASGQLSAPQVGLPLSCVCVGLLAYNALAAAGADSC